MVSPAHAGIQADSAPCTGVDAGPPLEAVTEGDQQRHSILRVAWLICFPGGRRGKVEEGLHHQSPKQNSVVRQGLRRVLAPQPAGC